MTVNELIVTGSSPDVIKKIKLIQRHWRISLRRRDYRRLFVFITLAALKIQTFWRSKCILWKTQKHIRDLMERRTLAACRMMMLSNTRYSSLRVADRRHLEIHLDGGVGRMFDIIDSKLDMVLLTINDLPIEMKMYYSKLLELKGGIYNLWGRLQILSLKSSPCGVGEGGGDVVSCLLSSPKILSRIKKIIEGYSGYVVIMIDGMIKPITNGLLQLSGYLGVPLSINVNHYINNNSPRGIMKLMEKSEGLRPFLPPHITGPWNDVDDIIDDWAQLCIQCYQTCCKWIIDVDGKAVEHADSSSMYIDLTSLAGTTDKSSYRHRLMEEITAKTKSMSSSSSSQSNSIFDELVRRGGIIQGIPSVQLAKISVHLKMMKIKDDGDNVIKILGTSESIPNHYQHTSSTSSCCLIPHCTLPYERDSRFMEDVGKRVGEALSDEGGIKVCNVTVDTIVFINPNFNEDLTKRVEAVAVEMEPSGLLTEGLEDGMFAALQSAKILHIDQTIDLVKDEDNVMLPAEGKEVNCVETAEEYFLRRMAQVIPNNYGCDSNGLAELDGNDPINKFALWITKVKFGVAEETSAIQILNLIKANRLSHCRKLGTIQKESLDDYDRVAILMKRGPSNNLNYSISSSHSHLFQLAEEEGFAFDLSQDIGTIFMEADLTRNILSTLTIDKSPKLCVIKAIKALSAIQSNSNSHHHHSDGPSNIDSTLESLINLTRKAH